MNTISTLEAKGIRPCEILYALAEQAHQQGNHRAADALLNAAFELRQGGSSDSADTDITQEERFEDTLATPFASALVDGDERRQSPTDFGF